MEPMDFAAERTGSVARDRSAGCPPGAGFGRTGSHAIFRPAAGPRQPPTRSGRPISPTKSVSPVNASHGSWPRVVSETSRVMLSGVWPGRVEHIPAAGSPTIAAGRFSRVGLGTRPAPTRGGKSPPRYALRQVGVPRDVIGMQVSFDDDGRSLAARMLAASIYLFHVPVRVDDGRDSVRFTADQV
jgi:hypothetical protein